MTLISPWFHCLWKALLSRLQAPLTPHSFPGGLSETCGPNPFAFSLLLGTTFYWASCRSWPFSSLCFSGLLKSGHAKECSRVYLTWAKVAVAKRTLHSLVCPEASTLRPATGVGVKCFWGRVGDEIVSLFFRGHDLSAEKLPLHSGMCWKSSFSLCSLFHRKANFKEIVQKQMRWQDSFINVIGQHFCRRAPAEPGHIWIVYTAQLFSSTSSCLRCTKDPVLLGAHTQSLPALGVLAHFTAQTRALYAFTHRG